MSAAVVQSVPAQDIEKLWSLEFIGIRDSAEVKSLKEEEKEALQRFREDISRDDEGRYEVSLPWKRCSSVLPNNRKSAVQRLRSATDRLVKTGKFDVYHSVFKNWEMERFIVKVPEEGTCHFIPHRPVFKDSPTTPVRPVYDASCRQGRNPSLNDCLYKGPNLIEHIPTMMLRFGAKMIGVSADIRKAFQMIGVSPTDRKFQRFLWWEDETCTNMVTYEHNRVVFGVTSSPFLLGATIQYHFETCSDQPMANTLKTCFYVDNLLTSVNSETEYRNFQDHSISIMEDAKMELRQWTRTITCGQTPEEDEIAPVLGLVWNRREDVLSVSVKKVILEDVVTKRIMLSTVAQVFHQMGYLAPAMVLPKMMIQEAWSKKSGWDESVPEDVARRFTKWASQMEKLAHVKIPRYSKASSNATSIINIFCDSSKDGMAAIAFQKTEDGKCSKLQFLICKCRLTPLKKMTIPRSELVSCVIGVRIANLISDSLDIPMERFVFWSDSMTALTWIKRQGDWGVFVSNRVKEIQLTTKAEQWNFVPGKVNPADLPSRGCFPSALLESKWWEGPQWLLQIPTPNFGSPPTNEEEVFSEIKKTATVLHETSFEPPRFSSYRQNVAVWGWVLRFVDNCRAQSKIKKEYLQINELRKAEKILLRKIQQESFKEDCQVIGGIQIGKDLDGLLRVKSRLSYRKDTHDFIYPIVLPKLHPFVDLLVMDVHRYFGHGGIQFLLNKLREKYWILQSRRVIRRVIRNCTACKRHTATPLEVDPAPLPKRRVMDGDAFSTTGVDLAGPLFLRDGSKVWIVVFTCAVYRAVYLDLVRSLSTEDFVAALERFVSLYGRPNTIYSDDGTNFVGAANLFSRVDWESVEKLTSARQIQWIFNPPTAAWWGGFWERMVRTVKNLLKRMLGRSRLTYDELRTCLCGVSATINDRPLTLVTEANMDLVALTPAMFLRPRGYGHVPDLMEVDGLRKGYKRMKNLLKAAQDRFRKEYLALLVTRGVKKGSSRIAVGDVVLVGADNKKRYEWPLGIVTELLPGKDGKVRLVKVKTSTGVFLRPLQRLYPLEISQPRSSGGLRWSQ